VTRWGAERAAGDDKSLARCGSCIAAVGKKVKTPAGEPPTWWQVHGGFAAGLVSGAQQIPVRFSLWSIGCGTGCAVLGVKVRAGSEIAETVSPSASEALSPPHVGRFRHAPNG
jgi:hypothetical protein